MISNLSSAATLPSHGMPDPHANTGRRTRTWLRNYSPRIWPVGTLLICLLVALPVLTVLMLTVGDNEGIWAHLAATVLPHYLQTTALLMLGVGTGTLVIGVATAWLTAMCEFPGKRVFEWALLLPMAFPAYIIAFVYTDVLEYGGPVQTMLRATFDWSSGADYWFPQIRSLGGAILMMTVTLYPLSADPRRLS